MAEEKNKQENQNFFTNLKKFFASSIVIKYTDDTEKIKVFDINSLQTIKNVETNRLIDKYFSLYKSGYNLLGDMSTTGFSTMRADLYRNYECLAGNTIIPTPDKEPNKTIQELSKLYPNKDTQFYVYSYDKKSKLIKLGVAHSVRKTKTDQTYKIVFDNDKNLIATSDHPILMRNGEYKFVKDLQVNDSVMPFYEKDFEYNQKIKSIEKYEIIDVYDMTVDTYHNFATENCFVHNCMDQDAVISAVLDLLSEEGSMPNEYGEVIAVNSEKEYIQKTLENLLYDVLNIEFNLPWWIRNLAKYGDFFMKLDIVETIGITNCIPLSVYGVERLEDFNNPALVRFSYDDALATNLVSYSNILANIRRQTFEQYEIAHFRLLADSNYLPYGRSYIEGARKIWNQLTLMIDAMMLQRIMRAPERRVFKIDVGTLAPDQVPAHMEKIISKLKKVPYIDETTGNYNLKFSLQPVAWYTNIPLIDGRTITIKDLAEETANGNLNYVYSIDKENNNKIVAGEVKQCLLTKKDADIVRVILDDDSFIDFEPSHPVMLRTGEYKAAKDLVENESLMPFYSKLSDKKGLIEYELVLDPSDEKYKFTHRIIAEQYNIDNYNNTNNIIHHKSFKKENNTPTINHKVKSVMFLTEKIDVYCMEVNNFHNFAIDSHNGIKRNGIFVKNTALEDFYLPVRGDKSGTSIETLPGMPPPPVTDLDFLEQRLYTALKIPKAFLANEESVNAKSTLASQDMRLARTIDRFHKIIVNELTKICVVHLYTQGYRDDDLIDFELEMFSPSTTYQLEKIELLDKKTDLAGKMKESKLFSDKFIYNTIYNMSDSEAAEEEEGIIYDLKKNWRHEQIGEGSDPASEMKLSASDYSSPEGGSSTNLGIETEEMPGEETSETEEGAEESTNKEETPPEEVGLKPKPEEEKESPESSVDKSLIDQEKEEDENEVDDEIEKARIARSRLKDKKQVKSTTLIGRKVSSLTKADENNPNIPAHNRNRTIYGNTVKREDFNKSGKKILKEYNDIGTFMDEESLENFK
jgi:intein/homing endonuclease